MFIGVVWNLNLISLYWPSLVVQYVWSKTTAGSHRPLHSLLNLFIYPLSYFVLLLVWPGLSVGYASVRTPRSCTVERLTSREVRHRSALCRHPGTWVPIITTATITISTTYCHVCWGRNSSIVERYIHVYILYQANIHDVSILTCTKTLSALSYVEIIMCRRVIDAILYLGSQ